MGDTSCPQVEAGAPIPWSMEMEVAPWMLQLRVDNPPAEMLLGLAVKEFITGGEPSVVVTVTVADAVTDP